MSSSAMSKVVADNKLPNKSVIRLPYGLFTLRWQNNSSVQDICLYRCHCFQHYLVIYYEMNGSYISFLFLSTKHAMTDTSFLPLKEDM